MDATSIYIATLSPTKDLEFLDLTSMIEEDCTEFESLDLAINFLFMAGRHSYRISRKIAAAIYASGIQGIIYPSYFSTLRTGIRPIETVIGISTRRISPFKEIVNAGSIIFALNISYSVIVSI